MAQITKKLEINFQKRKIFPSDKNFTRQVSLLSAPPCGAEPCPLRRLERFDKLISRLLFKYR